MDSSLNEVGNMQAASFYSQYKTIDFDKVYTSSLRRTKETVSGFIEDGINHQALPGLDEIHWGLKEGKPFDEKDHQEYQEVTQQWSMGNTHLGIAGGESPDQVQLRQQDSLNHIMSNSHEKTVLICMHGRAIRIFLCLLLNYPLKHMNLFPHHNTGLYRLTYTGNYFRLDKANCTSHLDLP